MADKEKGENMCKEHPTDTQVSAEEGGAGRAPGARAEALPADCGADHGEAAAHLQPMEEQRDAGIHLQPMKESQAGAGGCLRGGCDPVWREKSMLYQVFW